MEIQILILAAFGALCAIIAHSRGRSPIGWFFIGGIFGCFPLIVLFIIPDLKIEEEKEMRRERQMDRLKERQLKDRAAIDRKLETQNQRLSAHDQAIGIDTAPEETTHQALPPQRTKPARPNEVFASKEWFYAVDANSEAEFGPVSFADLRSAFQGGELDSNSLVWNEGMADWTPIRSVSGLREQLEGHA